MASTFPGSVSEKKESLSLTAFGGSEVLETGLEEGCQRRVRRLPLEGEAGISEDTGDDGEVAAGSSSSDYIAARKVAGE